MGTKFLNGDLHARGTIKYNNLRYDNGVLTGDASAIDEALIPSLGANRFNFMDPNCISVEYSRDGGLTWNAYPDTAHRAETLMYDITGLADLRLGAWGHADQANPTKDWQLRITLIKSPALYTQLKKFAIFIATQGSKNCKCTVQYQKNGSGDGVDQEFIADNTEPYAIDGWSGWNIININLKNFGSTSYNNLNAIRFIFTVDEVHTNTSYGILSIYKIAGYGATCYAATEEMAKTGSLYRVTNDKDAIFPNKIQATEFVGIAQRALADDKGNIISSTYALKSEVENSGGSSGIKGINLVSTQDIYNSDIQTLSNFNINYYGKLFINTDRIVKILKPSTTYTISFTLELIKKPALDTLSGNYLGFTLNNGTGQQNNNFLLNSDFAADAPIGTIVSKSFTFTTPANINNSKLYYYTRLWSSSTDSTITEADTFKVTNFKIEEGSEATDWNPAYNDVMENADGEHLYNKSASRGLQLVTNGTGVMGDNSNFSSWIFDGAVSNNSPGSFTMSAGTRGNYTTDEYFAIDPNKEYTLQFDIKSLNGVGKLYAFLDFYDVDKNRITAGEVLWTPNTKTTLTQDVVAGDTVIYVNDLSNWQRRQYWHKIAVWNYTNSFGYTYPAETYTRKHILMSHTGGMPNEDAFDYDNNSIKLHTAYSGPTIPAGTEVSQGGDGATFKYLVVYQTVPQEWATYAGKLRGLDLSGQNVQTKFSPGVAYVKVGFLWNYDGATEEQLWLTNVSVKDTTEDADTLSRINETNTKIDDANLQLYNADLFNRNYLLESYKETTTTSYLATSYNLAEKPIVEESYTFTLNCNLGSGRRVPAIYNSGGSTFLANLQLIDTNIYSATFNWSNNTATNTDTFVNIYIGPVDGTTSSTIMKAKLERGNQFTGWNLASEDIFEQALSNNITTTTLENIINGTKQVPNANKAQFDYEGRNIGETIDDLTERVQQCEIGFDGFTYPVLAPDNDPDGNPWTTEDGRVGYINIVKNTAGNITIENDIMLASDNKAVVLFGEPNEIQMVASPYNYVHPLAVCDEQGSILSNPIINKTATSSDEAVIIDVPVMGTTQVHNPIIETNTEITSDEISSSLMSITKCGILPGTFPAKNSYNWTGFLRFIAYCWNTDADSKLESFTISYTDIPSGNQYSLCTVNISVPSGDV